MPEFYFDKDDMLNRKAYGEFLQNILEHNEHNRRDDSNGAYVLAVDSPWGTGKTRFAIMLKNHLEKRFSNNGQQNSNEKSEFNAIYYDALGSDYNPDAMEPLMFSILNSGKFSYNGSTSDMEKLWKTCSGILRALGYGLLKIYTGQIATEIISGIEDSFSGADQDPLENYKNRLCLYEKFKTELSAAILRSKKKLVIIIDELDRCKPTFAIQTIEMAKHLFDVQGLVFVFFLDITQLSSAVKCVYGNEMDATGYLCRYFDFISRLPTPDTLHFIDMKLKSNAFCCKLGAEIQNVNDYVLKLCQTFQLSLRDISTILTNYSIMCSTILQNYKRFEQHRLYLFLLVMKYKNLELYNTIISDSILREEQERMLTNQGHLKKHSVEFSSLSYMMKRTQLRDVALPFNFSGRNEKMDPVKIINIISNRAGLLEIKCVSSVAGKDEAQIVRVNDNDNWGNMLFFHDLKNWQSIKNITLAEHFSRQLDQFQFTGMIPATSGTDPFTSPVSETQHEASKKNSKLQV